jgi:hypothetical protein
MTDSNKKPSHRVLTSQKFTNAKGEEKTRWLTIGSGWLTADGTGISGKFETLPIDGRFLIKPNEPKPTSGTKA